MVHMVPVVRYLPAEVGRNEQRMCYLGPCQYNPSQQEEDPYKAQDVANEGTI